MPSTAWGWPATGPVTAERNRSRILNRVKRAVLLYGISGGLLIAVLELVEYRFLVVEHSVEIYGTLIAILFASVGIWLGLSLTRTKVVVREVPVEVPVHIEVPVQVAASQAFVRNDARVAALGITPRELEILEHIAAGKSTREIAAALFVSENTVKTHASRLFAKLDVNRRTQAVDVGKRLGLIP